MYFNHCLRDIVRVRTVKFLVLVVKHVMQPKVVGAPTSQLSHLQEAGAPAKISGGSAIPSQLQEVLCLAPDRR